MAVHPEASIAEGARVEGSVVMAGAVVGQDADVSGSVVMPGAQLGEGARVNGSIVGPRSVVGQGASVTELSVLGDDVTVADGAYLRGERVPESPP